MRMVGDSAPDAVLRMIGRTIGESAYTLRLNMP